MRMSRRFRGSGSIPLGYASRRLAKRIEAARERLAGEREHRIHAVGREPARGRRETGASSVDGGVGIQAQDECRAVGAGTGREHPRAALLCELDGERADAAGRAVHDQRFAACELQCIVDALQGGQPRRRNRSSVEHVERFGNVRDLPASTATYSA